MSTAEGVLALKPLGQQLNVSTAALQLGLQHLERTHCCSLNSVALKKLVLCTVMNFCSLKQENISLGVIP